MLKIPKFHSYTIFVLLIFIVVLLSLPTCIKNIALSKNKSKSIIIKPLFRKNPALNLNTMSSPLSYNNESIHKITTQEQNSLSFIKKKYLLDNNWQNFRIKKGGTLAQLFRDNKLQVNDAFNMANIEGSKKILSNLYKGQKIRLISNKKGDVYILETIDLNGKIYSFLRSNTGNYYIAS
ncbi:Putative uncharacterized protein YtfB [Candidatus Providencia siddallii]|uniref:Opacity-associated protein A LysM-like domain-containing protein n=1 Tax=Candidatus Providencia siddallii TaxID=1715285 RepID=A0A0M6W8A1_9GAMM|nr:Putative uncharacterized protein YtfB [Candidatus Providencia siddallii]